MKQVPQDYVPPGVAIICPTGPSGGDWQDVRGYISHSFPSTNPGYGSYLSTPVASGAYYFTSNDFTSNDVCYVKDNHTYTFEMFPAYRGLVRVYDINKLYVCSLWKDNDGNIVCYILNSSLAPIPKEIMFSYEEFFKLNVMA